jgi:hypothetical protein
MEGSGIEFGRAEMASCVVGSSYTLAGDSNKVRIQLAVRILIVKNGYSIRSRFDPRELA